MDSSIHSIARAQSLEQFLFNALADRRMAAEGKHRLFELHSKPGYLFAWFWVHQFVPGFDYDPFAAG